MVHLDYVLPTARRQRANMPLPVYVDQNGCHGFLLRSVRHQFLCCHSIVVTLRCSFEIQYWDAVGLLLHASSRFWGVRLFGSSWQCPHWTATTLQTLPRSSYQRCMLAALVNSNVSCLWQVCCYLLWFVTCFADHLGDPGAFQLGARGGSTDTNLLCCGWKPCRRKLLGVIFQVDILGSTI